MTQGSHMTRDYAKVRRNPPMDWLIAFRYTTYCQGTADTAHACVLVRQARSYAAAVNRLRIAAPMRGWIDPCAFEDMTVDIG